MISTAIFLLVCILSANSCGSSSPGGLKMDTNPDTTSIQSAKTQPTSPFDTMPLNDLLGHLTGKFDPVSHVSFVEIERQYADRPGLFLHQEVYDAFKKMHAHAEREQVKLTIRSATRNFEAQKSIWEAKWKGATILSSGVSAADIVDKKDRCLEILKYSSMPGSSRHHWGTDIDLNAFNNAYFEAGEGKAIYQWLVEHAATYGFCQPYTSKGVDRPNGYEEEKWHWSFTPIASKLTRLAETHLSDQNIAGFAGADQAAQIQIIKNYVLGINTNCY